MELWSEDAMVCSIEWSGENAAAETGCKPNCVETIGLDGSCVCDLAAD